MVWLRVDVRDSLDNDTPLTRLYSSSLHLKYIRSILFFIFNLFTIPWQLSPLSDRYERRTEPHGDDRTEEESTSIETDNDIRLLRVGGQDVVHEMGD